MFSMPLKISKGIILALSYGLGLWDKVKVIQTLRYNSSLKTDLQGKGAQELIHTRTSSDSTDVRP